MKGIEDMELVIKIPRAYYELVLERCKDPVLLNAFKNGIPFPFMNKPCISSGVCEHDKNKVLDKIRAEMFVEMLTHSGTGEEVIQAYADGLRKGLDILDKYRAEIEAQRAR